MKWEFRKPLKKLGWAVGAAFLLGSPHRTSHLSCMFNLKVGNLWKEQGEVSWEGTVGRADSRAGISQLRVPLQPQLGDVLRGEARET